MWTQRARTIGVKAAHALQQLNGFGQAAGTLKCGGRLGRGRSCCTSENGESQFMLRTGVH